MSKAELPVSHIVAMVLGVIVLALLGYLVYTNFIAATGAVSEETCRSQFLQYCTFWSITGYKEKPIGYKSGFYAVKERCDKYKSTIGEDNDKSCKDALSRTKSASAK